MKKTAFLFLLFILLMCGCKQEYGILDYQNSVIRAECTINEKYKAIISKNNTQLALELKEPKKLNGVKFFMENDRLYMLKNEFCIPASKSELNGIFALMNIFSLDEGTMTTATNNSIVSFENEHGTYTLTFGKSSLPQKISIKGNGFEYYVVINAMEITKATD